MALQIGQRAIIQCALVGRAQHHPRGVARLEGFLPARGAKAPAVARLQSGKAEFGHGSRKVVAPFLREAEEPVRHHYADGVAAHILVTGVAAAIAKEGTSPPFALAIAPSTFLKTRTKRCFKLPSACIFDSFLRL